jgi:hypothetical protein
MSGSMSLLRAYIQATTISFHENAPLNDSIQDSGDGLIAAGFVDGDSITVSGSTSNDGIFTIEDMGLETYPLLIYVNEGEIQLNSDAVLVEELEGDTVTIQGTPWTFSPLSSGFDVPEERDRVLLESTDGTKSLDEVSVKMRWELPVNAVSSANFTKISQWWRYGSTLRFNPDTDHATIYNVRLINEQCPLSMMPNMAWNTYYQGVLIIEEI